MILQWVSPAFAGSETIVYHFISIFFFFWLDSTNLLSGHILGEGFYEEQKQSITFLVMLSGELHNILIL